MPYVFDHDGRLIELGTGRVVISLADEESHLDRKRKSRSKPEPGAGVRRLVDRAVIETKKLFSVWGYRR